MMSNLIIQVSTQGVRTVIVIFSSLISLSICFFVLSSDPLELEESLSETQGNNDNYILLGTFF